MELSKALTEAMRAAGLRDEEVAVRIGVGAHSIGMWRRGHKRPNQPNYDRLRRELPGFAERMDGKAAVA